MPNKPFQDLTTAVPAGIDIIPFVQDPSGSPIDKKLFINTLGTKIGNISANQIVSAQALTSFTNTSGTPLEKGFTLNNFSLNWTLNRAPDPISQSIDNGVGSIAVNLRTKVFTSAGITTDQFWTITVTGDDGTISSLTTGVSYLYPYYYGPSAQGDTGTEIGELTKLIATQSNKTISYTTFNQVPYFAYPSAYPDLVSILDPNGFETISDWTFRTVTIVGLDSTSQTYKVYEFNNLTTVSGFAYTFKY